MMRGNLVIFLILLIAVSDNSAFITKEFIQRVSVDIGGAFKQIPVWTEEQKDRLHGRLPYDRSSDGEIVDGKGSGLTRIVNRSPVSLH